MNPYRLAATICAGAVTLSAQASTDWMPFQPGPAKLHTRNGSVVLENRSLRLAWNTTGFVGFDLTDRWTGQNLKCNVNPFDLFKPTGEQISFRKLVVKSAMHGVHFDGGRAAEMKLEDPATGLAIEWRISLRDGSNYLREELRLTSGATDVDLSNVQLISLTDPGVKVVGSVPGSPIVDDSLFAGTEHPMAVSRAEGNVAISGIERKLPLKAGQTTVYTAVIGVAPKGQLRRAVLRYVERERARAYAPFLHYNSWYDLGYFNRYTADQCVERINTFADVLSKQRGVKLSSFLFDDGWDDTHTVWQFNSGFPQGLTPLKQAAEAVGAGPGMWLSPWGGYGTPNRERLAAGKAAGMEIDSQGYALSGPKYYERFRQVCLDLVGKDGVNQFKFDGTGSPDKQYPGSRFGSDFEAAIQLIEDLRKAKPGLFINLTTGTWPSPFWTRYADSIWRGGYDHNFAGVGPYREQWVTYRDADTYHGIVLKGPLYPLNSLMLHGLIYAQYADHLKDDPSGDFRNEVRDYFGTGTQLQEMYITPKLLSPQNWDDIAASAKWSRANADVLVDTHWVGGDPLKLEIYGWGSWNRRKGILVLRNPNTTAQSFSIDPRKVFELPEGAAGVFHLTSPYEDTLIGRPGSDAGVKTLDIQVGMSKVVVLQPFQVLVLEGGLK